MRRQAGFSLMEIVLVCVIAGSIMFLGMQLYLSMRKDADARQVRANVDAIFQAMANFYKANCYGQTKADHTVAPGVLNPAYWGGAVPPVVAININTDLIQKGFLAPNALLQTPIVNASGAAGTTQGYVAQFNSKTRPRLVCIEGYGAANTSTCTKTATVGTIIEWQAQVSVELDTTPATTPDPYLALLAGDCLSDIAGFLVTPCTGTNTGIYVVWQRNPSTGSKESGSTYWHTTPTVKQFNQMYTTYPMNSLVNSGGANQNYLCGN